MAKIDSNYKYLTYEKMAKDVAEKVLDEFLYNGKSIREWMQIITSEDCISRQDLVEKAVCWDKHFADGIRYVALTDILNAPPVTPQPKMGRWEKVTAENRDGSISWWYACSECGAPCPKTDYGTDYFGSYCSVCGRRMQEEE